MHGYIEVFTLVHFIQSDLEGHSLFHYELFEFLDEVILKTKNNGHKHVDYQNHDEGTTDLEEPDSVCVIELAADAWGKPADFDVGQG